MKNKDNEHSKLIISQLFSIFKLSMFLKLIMGIEF